LETPHVWQRSLEEKVEEHIKVIVDFGAKDVLSVCLGAHTLYEKSEKPGWNALDMLKTHHFVKVSKFML